MCDSNQIEISDYNDQQQFCMQLCDLSGNEQYENAQNCVDCQETSFTPPNCNECCPPQQPQQKCCEPCPPQQPSYETVGNFQACPAQTNFEFRQPQQTYEPCQYEVCRPKQPNFEACCAPQTFEQCQPCVTTSDQCDPCVKRCDPCEPLGPCPMPFEECQPRQPCPPLETCSPMCSPYQRCRYIQPPRRKSFKPVERYQRPTIPMPDDTVQKLSFPWIDSQTAAGCRLPPVRPIEQLRSACGGFAKETVTKLSFRPVWCPVKTKPIYPPMRSLLGSGPMQALTTQKHDFVPKFIYRQPKFLPKHNIFRGCGNIENTTVQRLSFMAPEKFSRVKSFKPVINYRRPELPMEFETTQKLSFMPVCPRPKDDLPWARKAKYCPPSVRFATDTVNKLSYQPPGCFLDSRAYCCPEKCDNMPRAAC